jgi:hypothetical protein
MQDVMVDGKPAYQLEGLEDNTPPEQAIRTVLSEGGIDEAISKLKHLESIDKETPKYWADAYKWLSENRKRISLEGGSLYEVDIPDTAINKMLDWDKPLSEQPESIQDSVYSLLKGIRRGNIDHKTGQQIYDEVLNPLYGKDTFIGQKKTSQALNRAGIPGIKYFDGSSRATSGGKLLGLFEDSGKWKAKVKVSNRGGVGFQSPTDTVTTSKAFDTKEEAEAWANSKINSGTRNFVVFNEKYVKPLKRDGKPIMAKPKKGNDILKHPDGHPLVVYRGSYGDEGRNMMKKKNTLGFFHSSSKDVAEVYAHGPHGEKGNALAYHVSMKKPYYMDNAERQGVEMGDYDHLIGPEGAGPSGWVEELKKEGYDGLIIEPEPQSIDSTGRNEQAAYSYVTFYPNQSKPLKRNGKPIKEK